MMLFIERGGERANGDLTSSRSCNQSNRTGIFIIEPHHAFHMAGIKKLQCLQQSHQTAWQTTTCNGELEGRRHGERKFGDFCYPVDVGPASQWDCIHGTIG